MPSPVDRRLSWAAVLLGLLPLFRLRTQSLWFDELFTVWVAAQPLGGILRHAAVDGYTPPLYYLLVAALSRAGLALESLRLLSVAGGLLTLLGLVRLAWRLGGRAAAVSALVVAGLSPFLVSLAQELRPYTLFLAAAAWSIETLLAWHERPTWPRALVWGAITVLAVSFSYLGFALLPMVFTAAALSKARRQGLAIAAGVLLAALALSLPGLEKGTMLFEYRRATGLVRPEAPAMSPLGRLVLGPGVGIPPRTDRDRWPLRGAQLAASIAVVLAGVAAIRRRDRALLIILAALLLAWLALGTADALMGLGLPTRYLSLAFIPFVAAIALLPARWPRIGTAAVALVVGLQLLGLFRYLFDPACAREDWRSLMARVEHTYAPGDVVLGFPLHHLAVAAAAYAPGVPVTGGFVGLPGEPVYLLRSDAGFSGYELEGRLEQLRDLRKDLGLRTEGHRVLLATYEDPRGHGDPRPVAEALQAGHTTSAALRFNGRETLVLRVLDPTGSGEREKRVP